MASEGVEEFVLKRSKRLRMIQSSHLVKIEISGRIVCQWYLVWRRVRGSTITR